ncbi:MAG: MBL fold metallo-hydrolase [Gammaproteobacteria bacterium]
MSAVEYPFAEPEVGVPQRIGNGVEWIRLPLPFPPHHVNVFRIATDRGAILVDTGFNNAATAEAWQTLGEPPASQVLVTHFHPDHIGQAARMEAAGATIHVPAPELAQARALHEVTDTQMQATFAAFFAAQGLAVPEAGAIHGNRYKKAVPNLPRRSRPLVAGALPFAPDWRVRFAGGHSPAHALLVRGESPVIAAGDILLPTITPNISVWPSAPDADPLGEYLAALEGLRDLPSDTLVLPAHGLPYRRVHERIEALMAHHEARLDLLRVAVKSGTALSGADAIPRLFGSEIKPASLPFALGEALAHLNRLWHLGEFERTRNPDGVYRYQTGLLLQ